MNEKVAIAIIVGVYVVLQVGIYVVYKKASDRIVNNAVC